MWQTTQRQRRTDHTSRRPTSVAVAGRYAAYILHSSQVLLILLACTSSTLYTDYRARTVFVTSSCRDVTSRGCQCPLTPLMYRAGLWLIISFAQTAGREQRHQIGHCMTDIVPTTDCSLSYWLSDDDEPLPLVASTPPPNMKSKLGAKSTRFRAQVPLFGIFPLLASPSTRPFSLILFSPYSPSLCFIPLSLRV